MRISGVCLTSTCFGRSDLPPGFRSRDYLRNWPSELEWHMRKSRFTEEQMVAIVREADRDPVEVVAKRHKITGQTIYAWKKKFGAFDANEVRRLKQLEQENARLKKLVAERDLEIEVMKEIAAKKWCEICIGLEINGYLPPEF